MATSFCSYENMNKKRIILTDEHRGDLQTNYKLKQKFIIQMERRFEFNRNKSSQTCHEYVETIYRHTSLKLF